MSRVVVRTFWGVGPQEQSYIPEGPGESTPIGAVSRVGGTRERLHTGLDIGEKGNETEAYLIIL